MWPWVAKVRDQREVKISMSCVAGDSGDETVLAEQFLEVLGSLRQAFRWKAHVLGYERRALWDEPCRSARAVLRVRATPARQPPPRS